MLTQPALQEADLLRERAFVDGSWIEADSGETFPVVDPATGEELARVPRMGAAETRRALEAARDAYPAWRARTAKERAAILRRWADLMLAHQEDLALLLTLEQGKLLAESRIEIVYAASFLEWFGEEAKRVYGDTIPTYAPDRRIVVLKEPVGVAAGITPWNFPAAMPTRKAAPALATGCTMVLKPAEQTPLSALAVARLAEEAGLPAGVFSVVTGDAEDAPVIGREMTSNPLVRKLGFTGSTEVGKLLMEQCAKQVKKISLDAIRIANDTPYGLAMYFYSRDVGRIWRVAEAAEYGILGINTGLISTEVAPFGGMKESGIGREGSKYGIDEWLEIKYLAIGGI